MGLGNKAESWSLYKQAMAIAQGRLDYALAMLLQLTEKWGGDHNDMFNFARSQNTNGNPEYVAGLLAAAHYQFWKSLNKKEAVRYYENENVKRELLNAFDAVKVSRTGADFSDQYQRQVAHNYIALSYSLLDDKKRARTAFKSIGKNYTPYPWVYIDNQPAAAYLRYRAYVGVGFI